MTSSGESKDNPEESTPAAADQTLFRNEVLAERQAQWLGTVLLAPTISHRLFTAFAVLTTVGVLGLMTFGDYTRKERVGGWLVPRQGLVRIFAPQPGVITQVHVRDGAEVTQGTPLLVLSTELESAALGATQEEIVRRLIRRRDSLLAERELHDRLSRQHLDGMTKRLDALQAEQRSIASEKILQAERVRLAETAIGRLHALREQKLLVEQRWQQLQDERLDHTLRLSTLERELAATERERHTLEDELRALPLENQARLAEIDRNIAALEQELAEAEARRRIVISAPQDGTVTAVQVEPGGNASTTLPLLNIIPADSELEARLLIPSRAIGFVRPGQPVLLRYQAFPYQKFGHHEGVVASISRSAVIPGEISQPVSGPIPEGSAEPVYPVTVGLARQDAVAYGESIPLQPGMQLEADILVESRSLYEWVLDPLFTLTGRWHG